MATRYHGPRHYPPPYDGYFQPRKESHPFVTLFYIAATLFIGFAFYVMFWPMLSSYVPSAPAPTVAPASPPQVAPHAQAPVVEQSAPIVEQAPAAPAPTALVVVPAAAPLRFEPTAAPPAWVPSAEQTAAYDAVRATQAPQVYGTDPTCNSANATYVTDPIKVEKNGVPIGAVQGWSCTSEADAVAEAQRRAVEMQAAH